MPPALDPDDVYRHEQAEQRLPSPRRRPRGIRPARWPRSRWTMSTCSSSIGPCRPSTTATSSSTWRVLEEFHREGRARSIGVSNFQIAHLERLAAEIRHRPCGQPDRGTPLLHATTTYGPTARSHGIATEAWSPIAQGARARRPGRRPVRRRRWAGRRLRWCCAGTSSAATSCSRSPRRPRASRRTSSCSTSSSTPRRRRDHGR